MFRTRTHRRSYTHAPATASQTVAPPVQLPPKLDFSVQGSTLPLTPGGSQPSAPAFNISAGADDADRESALRKLGVFFAMALLFLRFSMLHEIIGFRVGSSFFIVPIFITLATLTALMSGGLRRIFSHRSSYFWCGLIAWLLLSVPFSTWRGGSTMVVLSFMRGQAIMYFIIVGLFMTWKEWKRAALVIVLAGLVNLWMAATYYDRELVGQRFGLDMGGATIGNANDFAAHLMLLAAFALFLSLSSRWKVHLRILSLTIMVASVVLIVATGSRGASLALAIGCAFIFIRAPLKIRLASVAAVPILAIVLIALTPGSTLLRIGTLFSGSVVSDDPGAEFSIEARQFLLERSFMQTLQNPLFGVGPGEFQDVEAEFAKSQGRRSLWQVPHNSFTQISSEAGIPALVFLLGALVLSFKVLTNLYRSSQKNSEHKDYANAAFCMMLGMVTFCTACFFLSLPYHFYLPTISAMAVSLGSIAEGEIRRSNSRGAATEAPARGSQPFRVPRVVGSR